MFWFVLAMIVSLVLFYLILSKNDIIPDYLPFIGRIDDIVYWILLAFVWLVALLFELNGFFKTLWNFGTYTGYVWTALISTGVVLMSGLLLTRIFRR